MFRRSGGDADLTSKQNDILFYSDSEPGADAATRSDASGAIKATLAALSDDASQDSAPRADCKLVRGITLKRSDASANFDELLEPPVKPKQKKRKSKRAGKNSSD